MLNHLLSVVNVQLVSIRAVSPLLCRYATASTETRQSTVDLGEVDKFKKISTQWWNQSNSDVRALLTMNKLRVPFIRDGLINTGLVDESVRRTDKPLKGLKILDVGCGGGFLSEALARLGAQTTGLDASKDVIEVARIHMATDRQLEGNLNYINTSIEQFSSTNENRFDAIVSSEVIEHVVEKKQFLENCVKCLKPGGSVFMTTMSQTLLCRIVAIYFAENIFNILPRGTHEYDKLICPHTLQRLLEECDCSTRRIHGMTMNPITFEWCWVANTDVNYALHAVKSKK